MTTTETYLSYAIALAEFLAKSENVPNWEGAFVGRGRGSSHYYDHETQSQSIYISRDDVRRCTEGCYYDLKLLMPTWDDLVGFDRVKAAPWGGNIRGYESAWCIVIHEFAHVLQSIRGRERNKAHKEKFQEALRHLVKEYPFLEFANIQILSSKIWEKSHLTD